MDINNLNQFYAAAKSCVSEALHGDVT